MIVRGPAYLWNRCPERQPVHAGRESLHTGRELCHLERERKISFPDAYSIVRGELEADAARNPIYAAHLAMLEDPMLREAVEENIAAGMDEPEALKTAQESICAMFSDIDDEYLRARADDVRDIFLRLERALYGSSGAISAPIPRGAVLVAEELLPSDMARIDAKTFCGILCHRGSSTGHVCIIARAKGIPIQLGVDISGISDGDMVCVDDPLAGPSSIAQRVRAAGRKVYVNAGSLDEIRAAIAAGADGIGVFRTEFLFFGREAMPSPEEQRALYLEALLACEGKPLVIRLLDVGGDKALPYLPMPREDNPFLGLRGVRFGLARPGLYETQIGAVVHAAWDLMALRPEWFAAGTPVKLMIPMVCTLDEIRRVKQMLGLESPPAPPVSLGIMIETPAAVLDAAALAAECDFFSIGTNDLTQYIMAADRCNASVSELYDGLAPAVRRAVEMTVAAAHAVHAAHPAHSAHSTVRSGIPVGICGELASDPRATDFLLAAGLDSLSLSHL